MLMHRLLIVMSLASFATTGATTPASSLPPPQQRGAPTAPEAFTSQAQARTDAAGSATNLRIQIDRYIADVDRKALTDALTQGGYPGFVVALRKAPAIGHIALGGQKFAIRWARQQPAGKGRAITIVTDTPIYFVGGGRLDAKPREGFELAVLQFTVDEVGMGSGTMAAAAKVKPDGKGGVVLEDYAEEPIKLTYVMREI
jgi:hypothetical protein